MAGTGASVNGEPVKDKLETSLSSKLILHNFKEKLLDCEVHFQVVKLKDSFFLWTGTKATLGQLAVAMCSQSDSEPFGTNLFGSNLNSNSTSLAYKFAKKHGKPVFVSYNLPGEDLMLLSLVEKRILAEMANHPDKF